MIHFSSILILSNRGYLRKPVSLKTFGALDARLQDHSSSLFFGVPLRLLIYRLDNGELAHKSWGGWLERPGAY